MDVAKKERKLLHMTKSLTKSHADLHCDIDNISYDNNLALEPTVLYT